MQSTKRCARWHSRTWLDTSRSTPLEMMRSTLHDACNTQLSTRTKCGCSQQTSNASLHTSVGQQLSHPTISTSRYSLAATASKFPRQSARGQLPSNRSLRKSSPSTSSKPPSNLPEFVGSSTSCPSQAHRSRESEEAIISPPRTQTLLKSVRLVMRYVQSLILPNQVAANIMSRRMNLSDRLPRSVSSPAVSQRSTYTSTTISFSLMRLGPVRGSQ